MSHRSLGLQLVATVAACGDSTGPGASGPLTGRWISQTGFSFPIDVTLSQRDSIVQGTGTIVTTSSRIMTVIGHVSSSTTATHHVILTFAAVNTVPAIFFANLSANQDTLTGDYRWTSGLPAEPAIFVRQR
jgi:hypothetical protein